MDSSLLDTQIISLVKRSNTLTLGHTRGGEGGGGGCHPPLGFLGFFQEDQTSASDVFSKCSFIPRTHFEKSSVMIISYGYEV